MSTTLAGEPTAAPPRRRIPLRRLWWVIPVLLVLAVGAYLTLLNPQSSDPLDPDNPGPQGARAIAQVLERQGVDVRPVGSLDALRAADVGAGTSVVITQGQRLSTNQWRQVSGAISGADRVILIMPGEDASSGLDIDAELRPTSFPTDASADCADPVARGLTVRGSGERYAPADGSGLVTCFPPSGGFDAGGDRAGLMLSVPRTAGRAPMLLIGSNSVVRNSEVESSDYAALGLRALGGSPRLVWWNVTAEDLDHSTSAPARFPPWVRSVWIIALLTLAVLMLARGRRLGRLVTEALPVVVHADETTRARGQLYRKSGDLERAAAVLRSATRRRLASYLQAGARDRTLVPVVSVAARREPDDVEQLLFGPPPQTETQLTDLAQRLRDLEREIRP